MTFRRAVRQKTRWNIGIALQSWQNLGWQGTWAVRWNLFQDRKALLSTPANFLAYFVFAYFLLYIILITFFVEYMLPLIREGTLLWYLVYASTFFMAWRSLNRAYAVYKIYGFWPALTSIPRVLWGNVINFFAIVRAVWQFSLGDLQKRKVAWDKTAHEFPSEVIEEGKAAAAGVTDSDMERHEETELNAEQVIQDFLTGMTTTDEEVRIQAIRSVNRANGLIIFSYLVGYINDTSWRIRAEVCRTLSFLRFAQAIPYLEQAATDPDWVVRSNAVRAIGKLGDLGEQVLLRIIKGNDKYASDAAQAILENQGFFTNNTERLKGMDREEIKKALVFFDSLAKYGQSKLAQEVVDRFFKYRMKDYDVLLAESSDQSSSL